MTVEITFGWWMVSALVTVGAFAWAIYELPTSRNPGPVEGVVALMLLLGALCVSLFAWLVWAVLA